VDLTGYLRLVDVNFMAQLNKAKAATADFGNQVKQSAAHIATGFAGGSDKVADATSKLMQFRNTLAGASVAVGILATGFTALGIAMVKSFADQEQAFSGILKTVEATDEQFEQLRDNLTTLSNRIPVKFEDLAKIGELAGQLGVQGVSNLTKFIETIARVTESTNLSTEAAAIGFARIASIMQEPIANVDRMAAVVVHLGNKFEATESEIVNFATRIAATGKIAGMTTGEVFALATAFTSVGVQAEAGGTAINKMITEMATAVSTNSDKLLVFAKLAEETPGGFQKLFRTEPAEAFKKVLEGLGREGEGAFGMLEAITGLEARFVRAMLSEAQAGGMLSRALVLQNQAWKDNLAHIIESEKKFGTLTAHFRILQNNIENFAASLGATLAPALRLFSQIGTAIVQGFQGLPELVKTFIALTIAAVALTLAFTALLTTIAFIAIAIKAIGISLTVLAIGFGVTTGALVILGGAVLLAVKYFGLFSETSNQLEERLRGQKGAIAENASSWKGWWQAFKDTMNGAGVAMSKLYDAITIFFPDVLLGMLSWAEEFVPGWDKIWKALKTVVSFELDLIKTKFEFLWQALLSTPGLGQFIAMIQLFHSLGAANRVETEKTASATKDWIAAMEVANAEFPKQRAQLGSSVLSMEEYERAIRKIELAMQRQSDAVKINATVLKVQRETEKEILKTEEIVFRERERAASDELDEKLKTIGATRSGLEQELGLTRDGTKALSEKIALMSRGAGKLREDGQKELVQNQQLFKDRSKKIDEITKKIEDANTDRILAEQGYSFEVTKIWRDREELKLKDLFASAKVNEENDRLAIESARMLFDVKEDQSDRLKELYESDTETFIRETKKKGNYAAAQLEESLKAVGTSEEEILRRVSKELSLIDVKILEFLRKGLRESRAEVSGLREAMGLEQWTLDYQKLTLAQAKFSTSYKDLLPWQRDYIDILAESRAEQEKNKLLTEQQTVANNALMVGLGRLVGVEDARYAQDIKRREARLKSVLDTLTTENDAAQQSAILTSQIQQQAIIRASKTWEGFGDAAAGAFAFAGAKAREYVASQDTVWQGFAKMLVTTFDGIQRTLSDVFFDYFTTGTFDLQKAWTSMLNSMLRALSDFLAQQAVKTFLSFLFGAPEGSTGLAAMAGTGGASLVGGAGSSGLLGGVLGSVGKALGLVAPTPAPTTASGSSGSSGGGISLGGPSGNFLSYLSQPSTPTFSMDLTPSIDWGSLGDFGLSEIAATDWGGGWASGGRIPGSGRGDIVPAMLEPGEFVVRRSVAEAMGPTLDALNAFGRPTASGGRLLMATGGQVDLTGLAGTSIEDLRGLGALQSIGFLLQQQIAIQQEVAENTGATAGALGAAVAPEMTAGFTSITGSGGAARPVTVGGAGQDGGGIGASEILGMLGGGVGLARSGSNLFAGLTGTTGMGGVNALLSALTGGIGLASGLSSGNVLQATGGGLSLLSAAARFSSVQSLLNETFGSSLIGSGSTALGAGGLTSSALGIAGGGLGLYASISSIIENGVSTGNVAGALLNAYQIYSAAAPIVSALTGTALPTFTSLVGTALTSSGIAFSSSAALGAGVTATGGAVGVGTAAGTMGAGLTAGIMMAPLAVGMIINSILDMQDAVQVQRQISQAQQDLRTVIPQIIEQIPAVADSSWAIINDPASTPQQVRAAYDRSHEAFDLYRTYWNYFATGSGAWGNVEVPQLLEIQKQLQPYSAKLQGGMLRAADRLASTPFAVSASDPFLNPVPLAANLFGVPVLSAGAGDINMQTTRPEDYGVTGSPWGPVPKDIYEQILANVKPGQLEQSLAALANLYGSGVPDMYKTLGFGTVGTALDLPKLPLDALNFLISSPRYTAQERLWMDTAHIDPSPGGMASGGWVTGGIPGLDSVPILAMPGEPIIPAGPAKRYAPLINKMIGGEDLSSIGPQTVHYNVSITVNGHDGDPQELARVLAPRLRDELKRIDPRYSRAGSKSQV